MAPTVLLLHGFTNTGASWDPVVAALGERYRAVAPDIRGHGSASLARPVMLEAVIADIAGLAPDRFTLAGYSQGARIALHAALAPALGERVERLVLIGDGALADEIEGARIEEFATRWAATPVLADQPATVTAAAHADRLLSTPAGLAAALRGLGTGTLPPLWGRLEELGMPVTLIAGERDEKFRDIGERMAREIALADLVVVAGAGHAVHLEAPARVAAEIGKGG